LFSSFALPFLPPSSSATARDSIEMALNNPPPNSEGVVNGAAREEIVAMAARHVEHGALMRCF